MKPQSILSLLAVLGCLASHSVSSQEHSITLEEVVVSGSHLPSTLRLSSGVVTRLSRQQIEQRNPADVTELLRTVPGVHIEQTGGRGGLSSVFLRGADPNFTVVLVDGVQVNDPTNARGGSFDFSTLNVEVIESVEVVRGATSAVYGSDALAGVINITTRGGSLNTQAIIRAEVGEHGQKGAHAGLSGPVGNTGDFAVHVTHSDGGTSVTGSSFEGTALGAKVFFETSDDATATLTLRHSNNRSTRFPDDSGGDQFAVIRDVDRSSSRETIMGSRYEHFLSDSTVGEVFVNFLHRNEQLTSPGVAPGVRNPFGIPANSNDSDFYRLTLGSQLTFAVERTQFVIGGDYKRERGSDRSALIFFGAPVPGFFSLQRETVGLYVEAKHRFFDWADLEFGLRADVTDDFGTETSPRLGLGTAIGEQTYLKLSYGEGFKLPSFFALGNPIVGNTLLRPETSRTLDLSMTHELSPSAFLTASIFTSEYTDIIDFDPGPPPSLVNRSEVETRGVDLSFTLTPSDDLSVTSALSYVDTDIKNDTRELLNRPKWRGSVSTSWKPRSDTGLSATYLYVGEVFDSSIPTGDRTLSPYHRVDLAATWQALEDFQLTFAIDNVLDEQYEEALGFSAPGRHFRLATQWRF